MSYHVPINGHTISGDSPNGFPWGGARRLIFDRDGGLKGTRLGPYGNTISGMELILGDPSHGPAGSPRLDIEGIALHECHVTIRSAYLSRFSRVETLRGSWATEVDRSQRDTWPSAMSWRDCAWLHCGRVALEVPDIHIDGCSTFERNGSVWLGLFDHSDNAADRGGGLVISRFESDSLNPDDGGQVVHVGRGVVVIARYAVLTRFYRYPGAGPVVILGEPEAHRNVIEDLPGATPNDQARQVLGGMLGALVR